MESQLSSLRPVLHSRDRRAWYAFGLWLRVVLVGLGVMASGVALLLERSTGFTPASACLIGGGVLAAFASRRAGAALKRVDCRVGTNPIASNDNLHTGHLGAVPTPVRLFGLSVDATALELPSTSAST